MIDLSFSRVENICLQNGFKRLKQIKPDFTYQKWFFDKTIDKTNIDNFSFYTDSYKSIEVESISAKSIVGTTHSNYINLMWIEMLGGLDRFDSNVGSKNEMLQQFMNTQKQEKKVSKYGDFYIISGEGNHRICLSKFLDIDITNAQVSECEFNDKYYTCWHELKKRTIVPINLSNNLWKFLLYNVIITVKNEQIRDFIDSYDNAENTSKWRSFFGGNKSKIKINKHTDLANPVLTKIINQHKRLIDIKDEHGLHADAVHIDKTLKWNHIS